MRLKTKEGGKANSENHNLLAGVRSAEEEVNRGFALARGAEKKRIQYLSNKRKGTKRRVKKKEPLRCKKGRACLQFVKGHTCPWAYLRRLLVHGLCLAS